ncbi:hypothetical protein BCR41DRAFT_68408 [Lobosporangium transversale]|uniref:Uncharacterized protein n=1 Tax=Lobosporangium transversale TaxID=64571 RepID=A0A1Y2H0Y0_9FUNG|nr:hypothetical protein BCR41DRAFT_68408 [Lobosporangium transversale]ORZ28185.1 hypothetical protein BCR41DRAFT_68408 [Lobosporangium transversale]|eukprot:XP_021885870.1 hypothetical protein BCR41DRAFT_68408 [Lobosporangium transversale]
MTGLQSGFRTDKAYHTLSFLCSFLSFSFSLSLSSSFHRNALLLISTFLTPTTPPLSFFLSFSFIHQIHPFYSLTLYSCSHSHPHPHPLPHSHPHSHSQPSPVAQRYSSVPSLSLSFPIHNIPFCSFIFIFPP